MANPRIVVDFVANTTGLISGMNSATGATGGFGARMKSLGRTALAAAGTAGIGAVVATLKTGIDEFSEASKVSAQTAAVLKSTGGAANVSAKQISDLAGSLMRKTGIDDEAIQSGENLLLTFTKVQNQAGKGNDIFTQATRVMTDMSVALGQDMKSSAIQLGKALNDPVKGVTALQRVGVSFTSAQKEQIKALVDSGHTMDAQKLILRELNKEFGGSAEAAGKTLPGQLNILKQQFSNLAGELVGSLIPAFTTMVGVFTKVMGALGPLKGALPIIVISMGALAALVITVSAATAAWTAVVTIASAATKIWAAAQWLINAALSANPIGIVIVALAALAAGLVLAYKESDTFRKIVDTAFSVVANSAKAVFNWLKSNWPLIVSILTGPFGAAVVAIATHWSNITDAAKDAVSSIRSALSALASWIAGAFKSTISAATHAVGAVFDFLADGARDAYDSIRRNLDGVVNYIEGIVGKVRSAASSVANAIKGPINSVLSAWNSITLTIPTIKIPSIKIGKHKIGGGSFGGQSIGFPNVPLLAQGGVIDVPTLAMVGEGQGREIVTPEALLRDIVGQAGPPEVHVYIGDTELRGLVRTEIVDANTGIARVLLAGAR